MTIFAAMTRDEFYMQRCLQLAKNATGQTFPNPLVGSVVVLEERIIGEGWHQKAGEPHAEVRAINAVKDKSLLREATVYVNLEPCSHYGKTPPCADLLVASGVKRVVIGAADSNAVVSGRGIDKLRQAGISVTTGVLETECRELNKRFYCFHERKRPWILLKWAESADGFLSPGTKNEQAPVYLTGLFSRQLVHRWRSEEQAILIGSQTAIDDNPELDVRLWYGENPVKILIDRRKRVSENHAIFKDGQTIVFSEPVDGDFMRYIMDELYRAGIQSVLVEGGGQTLTQFIQSGFWDEARVFTSGAMLGSGTVAPVFKAMPERECFVGGDRLVYYKNPSAL